MTVSNSNNRTQLIADGSTRTFDFNFKIFSASELAVFVAGALVATGFTVSGIDNEAGGTVTFNLAPENGSSVVMLRDMEFTQEADYLVADPFSPEVHEKQLDRQTMMIQQIREESDRSIKIPVDSTSAPEIEPDVIQIVADNSDEIVDLAQNIDAVIGVNNNEQNVNEVATNLTEIQQVAGTISMSNVELNLVLGSVEIQGTQYTKLSDAISYAETILQAGGTLNISVGNITINETQQVNITSRLRVNITGVNSSSSVISSTSNIIVDNSYLSMSGINYISSSGLSLSCRNNSHCDLIQSRIEASSGGTALDVLNNSFVSSSFTPYVSSSSGSSSSVILVRGFSSFTDGGTGLSVTSTSAFDAILAQSSSKIIVNSLNVNGTATNGLSAQDGSRCIVKGGTFFDVGVSNNYDPPADTYGNFYSRIITTQ